MMFGLPARAGPSGCTVVGVGGGVGVVGVGPGTGTFEPLVVSFDTFELTLTLTASEQRASCEWWVHALHRSSLEHRAQHAFHVVYRVAMSL